MGRKKNPETLEKERNKLQKEIAFFEQILSEKKNEVDINEKIDKIQTTIKEDLLNQLLEQEKLGKHFEDMVDDYIYFVGLKIKMQNDIDIHGLRINSQTGNGYTTSKPNESVQNLVKVNAQMLKILSELNLKEPVVSGNGGDEGDDLL